MRILRLIEPWGGLGAGTAVIVLERGMRAGAGPAAVDPKRAETLLALGIAEESPEEPASEATGAGAAPRGRRSKKARG